MNAAEELATAIDAQRKAGQRWGGKVKNQLYCPTCEAELAPDGRCSFCEQFDAVFGGPE